MRLKLLSAAIFASLFGWAAPSVRIVSNVPSPQPVGTVVGFYAVAGGGPYRLLRDFTEQVNFPWRPELFEREAAVKVKTDSADSFHWLQGLSAVPYGSNRVYTPPSR